MTEISTQLALIEFQCQLIREVLESNLSEDPIQTQSLQRFVDSLPDSNLFEVGFSKSA
jgi:hypothetical protein